MLSPVPQKMGWQRAQGLGRWILGARLPGLRFRALLLTRGSGGSWASYSTSLCLSFLICKVGARITVTGSWRGFKVQL